MGHRPSCAGQRINWVDLHAGWFPLNTGTPDVQRVYSLETLSGRSQTSAFRFVIFNQFQYLGLKNVLRRIDGTNRLGERLLLELFLDR